MANPYEIDILAKEIRQGFDVLAAAILASIGGGNGDALTQAAATTRVLAIRRMLTNG